MARSIDSHISKALASVLPRRRIRNLARTLGVVLRHRKVDVVALVYSLVLGFGAGDRRSLSGLRRAYFRVTGTRLAPSSFHARFTEGLTQLLRTLTLEALEKLARKRPKLRGVFEPFTEVLAVDSAILRLSNTLAALYPSIWSNYMKASAKLTVVMNVVGRGAKKIKLSPGSRHDTHLLNAGPWMKGRLLIFDLGFFRTLLFLQIDRHDGFFISRARKHGNPVIVRCHRRGQGHLRGMLLKDALEEVDGDLLDVDATMVYQKHQSVRPRTRTLHATFRFVAARNHESDNWHCYVTNLPPSAMRAEHFTAVYAARWEVELLFRELKGIYRIEQMPSANRHVTESLIFAALLALIVSRRLLSALNARWKLERSRLPLDRWAALFAAVAQELLDLLLHRHDRARRARNIERFLRAEAVDPNRARIPLPCRAEQGLYLRA